MHEPSVPGISVPLTETCLTAAMSDKQDEVLASSTANRRRVPRRRSFLGAQIIFRNGNCSMTCLIADVSETGALIRPLDMVLCPNKFVLRPRFDPPRECEVVWRKGELLGVRFID